METTFFYYVLIGCAVWFLVQVLQAKFIADENAKLHLKVNQLKQSLDLLRQDINKLTPAASYDTSGEDIAENVTEDTEEDVIEDAAEDTTEDAAENVTKNTAEDNGEDTAEDDAAVPELIAEVNVAETKTGEILSPLTESPITESAKNNDVIPTTNPDQTPKRDPSSGARDKDPLDAMEEAYQQFFASRKAFDTKGASEDAAESAGKEHRDVSL